MSLNELIALCKRYIISILVVLLGITALSAVGGRALSSGTTYTATATSHMDVSSANDYDPDNVFNHVTRSQLAYQKMKNYEVLYTADEIVGEVLATTGYDYTPDEIREATVLTTDPDRLTETVEVTLSDEHHAITVANGLVEATAARIAEIEGDDTYVVTNIAPANADTTTAQRTSPKKVLVLGFLLGALCAFTQAIYRSVNDRRVHTVADIQSACSLPVLAVMPLEGDTASPIRHIRTSLLDANDEAAPIVMTALTDADDSAELARQLASSYAAAGHAAIVADANESASLSHSFDAGASDGLTNASRTAEGSLPLHSVGTQNLRLIPVGTAPSSAADSLASPAIQSALANLARENVLIIDSGLEPAALPEAITLYVARYGQTTQDDLARASARKEFAENTRNAIVLTGADFSPFATFRFGKPGTLAPSAS